MNGDCVALHQLIAMRWIHRSRSRPRRSDVELQDLEFVERVTRNASGGFKFLSLNSPQLIRSISRYSPYDVRCKRTATFLSKLSKSIFVTNFCLLFYFYGRDSSKMYKLCKTLLPLPSCFQVTSIHFDLNSSYSFAQG